MRLSHRLIGTSVVLVVALTAAIAGVVDRELRVRVRLDAANDLTRDARLVAAEWTAATDPLALAYSSGAALGRRVTLIRPNGVVVGDSELDTLSLSRGHNYAGRPEVAAALSGRASWSRRESPSGGDIRLYAAVPSALGVTRVSMSTRELGAELDRALRDIWTAGIVAAAIALALALLLARGVSRPVMELRDVARAVADGDLWRRATISAPDEIGDLSDELHRMSDQLEARMQRLANDEALLTAVVDCLSEGVVAIGPRLTVLQINQAARAMLNAREPIPFPVSHLPRHSSMRQAVTDALSGSEGGPIDVEIAGRMLSVAARPLAAGGAVVVLSDLTQARRVESMRRDFVANVSHELRTPLTAISGFADTLSDGTVSDKDRERFVATIAANARRMQRLVDELLDLSRIESGGWTPQPVPLDVAAVAADTFAGYADAARCRDVALETQISPDARNVHADPTALRQIMGNLVENAIRHTSSGTVTIFAQRKVDGTTCISVRDTGVGIASVHLSRIFERFYRADPARSRNSGGTGLGLAVVKHLVEAHRGSVGAESTPGHGTTISVHLPPATPASAES